jgi:hypothetical protein
MIVTWKLPHLEDPLNFSKNSGRENKMEIKLITTLDKGVKS